jgi:hypothetical protein
MSRNGLDKLRCAPTLHRGKRNNILNRPQAPSNARRHCRSDPQALMNPANVVVHVEQRYSVHMVLDFLAEGVGESGKAPHVHVWIAQDYYFIDAKIARGAVPFFRIRIFAVTLDQLRVINIRIGRSEGVHDGGEIHPVAVRGQLNPIRQTALNILEEICRTPRRLSSQPAS